MYLSTLDSHFYSENQVVTRGVKAIGLIYHLTGRVPALIKQSHLEEHEGNYLPVTYFTQQIPNMLFSSLGRLLVTYLPISDQSMHQPMSRYKTPRHLHTATLSSIRRASLQR